MELGTTAAMTDSPSKQRPLRVAERIRQELMTMLLSGELHQPGLADVYVSHVTATDDLRLARVYVRRGTSALASEPEQKRIVRALGRASGFLRRELGGRLGLRYTPELTFFWDSKLEEVGRVEGLLAEIAREREGSS
jgi:ribosome-binding factor A